MNPDLIIHHISGDRFQVLRGDGVSVSPEVKLPDPTQLRVLGLKDQPDLPSALRWYFEKYLRCPSEPMMERAAHVLQTLDGWGRESFGFLFSDHRAHAALNHARAAGPGWSLRLQSGDGRVLSWPWEALRDPSDAGELGLNAALERRVSSVDRTSTWPTGLATDRVRVLLVTARPLVRDIGYRVIGGTMVEQIQRHTLPIEVRVLRPATYRAFQEELQSCPLPYHILHFDCHGDQREGKGQLYFETSEHGPDPIEANVLAQWLSHHPVPIIVLNACRAASHEPGEVSPFSTVATELLRGGVRSVVAMTQVLQRDGAMEFVPAFYRELMRSGSVSQAVMRGRLKMQQNSKRTVSGGSISLRDEILPVVYQNNPVRLGFSESTTCWRRPRRLPAAAAPRERLYSRDIELLQLERFIQSKRPLTLVHGPPNAGKTELVKDFVSWLDDTGWSGRIDWIDLNALGGAGAILNRMGMVFGQDFFGMVPRDRIARLVGGLDGRPVLTVWDGLEGSASWAKDDRALLSALIDELPFGRHSVIATTREVPVWLEESRYHTIAVKAPPTGRYGAT